MRLTLGLSSCPNDTFIFDALIHHKIDTEDLEFDAVFGDIEHLNRWALEGKLDITKLSYNAFMYCTNEYILLDSGSALGRNCGPLFIKKKETTLLENSNIAIPGKYTTANMLLSFAYPDYKNKVEILFSDIEQKIIDDEIDGGVIIHENRFTYQDKGLIKIRDLGEFWEERTLLPIPLGGVVVNRRHPFAIQKKVEKLLRKSVEYAFDNRGSSIDFIKHHSQEIQGDVIDAHIRLYVNEFSISLGRQGKLSIERMFEERRLKTSNIFLKD